MRAGPVASTGPAAAGRSAGASGSIATTASVTDQTAWRVAAGIRGNARNASQTSAVTRRPWQIPFRTALVMTAPTQPVMF